jgi:hypothetical protein
MLDGCGSSAMAVGECVEIGEIGEFDEGVCVDVRVKKRSYGVLDISGVVVM